MLLQLKITMLRRGMSQAQLAKELNAAPARVSRIVRGHVTARTSERVKIARLLGVDSSLLFPNVGRALLRGRQTKAPAQDKAPQTLADLTPTPSQVREQAEANRGH